VQPVGGAWPQHPTDKRDRADTKGRCIGYRNGLALNATLATKEAWTAADIETRTSELAEQVIARFALA